MPLLLVDGVDERPYPTARARVKAACYPGPWSIGGPQAHSGTAVRPRGPVRSPPAPRSTAAPERGATGPRRPPAPPRRRSTLSPEAMISTNQFKNGNHIEVD